jgi:hypothetical protein
MPNKFIPNSAGLTVCCLAGLMLSAQPVSGQDTDSWWQHLRVGAPVTFNVHASFSESGTFMLPGGLAGAAGVTNVDHVYDNGYVKVDNTGTNIGYTSFWGYNSASQYNAAAQTLTFLSSTAYTTSGSATSSGSAFVGFEAAYGTDIWKWDQVHIGWEAGFGLTPIKISDSGPLLATVNQSAFTFSTAGIIPPTAPYNGGPSGLGPNIQNVATAAGTTNVAGTVTGSRSLNVIVYTLRLGPTIYWDMNPYVGLMAGAGPAVGFVNGNYEFNENIVTSGGGVVNNSGKMGMTKTVFGGYVNANLVVHVVKNGDFYLGGQFMPLGNAGFNSGGRQAQLDLSGAVQVTAGINWPF